LESQHQARIAQRAEEDEAAKKLQSQSPFVRDLTYLASKWEPLHTHERIIRALALVVALATLVLSILAIVEEVESYSAWATFAIALASLSQILMEKIPVSEKDRKVQGVFTLLPDMCPCFRSWYYYNTLVLFHCDDQW
jgi:hypothetical protein